MKRVAKKSDRKQPGFWRQDKVLGVIREMVRGDIDRVEVAKLLRTGPESLDVISSVASRLRHARRHTRREVRRPMGKEKGKGGGKTTGTGAPSVGGTDEVGGTGRAFKTARPFSSGRVPGQRQV